MLTITIKGDESWDEEAEKFCYLDDVVLQFEHSLVSLSKWESIFEKPFLDFAQKTPEEMLGYLKCMVRTPDVSDETLERLSEENVLEINEYINAKKSATWFSDTPPGRRSSEMITSELIYYWMDMFGIKIECEEWHLNRLFNLIRVHNVKQQKPKKISQAEAIRQQRELNAQRKAKLGTSG